MAQYATQYWVTGTYSGGIFTANTDSISGDVTASDNENVVGQDGSETFEGGDNMSTSGAISAGGQYEGFNGDGWLGLQGGTDYRFFSNTPLTSGQSISIDPGPFGPLPVCFLEGTLIATDGGEVAVETLRVGDLVVVRRDGVVGLEPVTWIGRMDVAVPPGPPARGVAPVTVRAGALGAGMPARDLRVSPEHALLVDGVLVPAGLVVNGHSILQETFRRTVSYVHLELATHGLLLSDGAWSESYRNNGNRHLFDNAAVTLLASAAAGGLAARQGGEACLPLIEEGAALDRIRAGLAGAPARLTKAG